MSDADPSALAQRLAKTHNLDLSTLSGSGANGMVTARDVLEHLNQEPGTDSGIAEGDSDSIQGAETETRTEAEAEPLSPQATQAAQKVEKVEESQPAQPDSDAPRWMFWRR